MNRKLVSDTWQRGNPYELYVGRWSRVVAPVFLDWLQIPGGKRWLDLGCGTGALCAAIDRHCAPAALFGVEPSGGFLETAAADLAGRADLRQGSAVAIPLDDEAVDVVVSGLVLNFVEDLPAALSEMARVTADGGLVAAYVWDYAGRMEFMRHFWDAAVDLDPQAARLDEGLRFPGCRPEALVASFSGGMFGAAESTAIDITTRFDGFDDFWLPFLGGQGPAPSYVMSLEEPVRLRLREHLRARLPHQADGSISMIARAWAVRARVARHSPGTA